MDSVLVAAPTSNAKDYCVEDWIKQVQNFSFSNYNILLVDNSGDKAYQEKLKRLGIRTLHIEPEDKPAVQYITESQNMIRHYFLNQGKWSHLLMLETDNFILRQTLEYLLMYDVPVINVSYFYKDGKETALCLQATLTSERYSTTFTIDGDAGFQIYNGQVKDMRDIKLGHGMVLMASGIGCTLIRRNVMEQFEFRYDKNMLSTFSDSFFHLDLLMNNIPNFLHTGLLSEHRRMSWRGNWDIKKKVKI